MRCGVVKELHATTLGRILRDQGFSFQRPKTWKESPDPDFAAKKTAERVCALYRAAPPNGRVICFDEFGPIEVRLLAAQATRGDRLSRRPQRGARLHADLRLVAESDRSDLLGRPLFRAGQLRIMGARGARSGTRRGCARRIGGSMARANTSRPTTSKPIGS